jgi:hypothetical protein
MADINGVERTYANKDEYDWEGGEVDNGPDFDTYTVDVKWTGTIASFNIMAENQAKAIEIANEKLDMDSNGLIFFDARVME